MNRDESLSVISRLSDVIGLLEGKWERPQSGAEAALIQSLCDIRKTVRAAHERQERLKPQQQAIFARMTPEAVSDLLVNVSSDIFYQQESGMNAECFELDIIHLRQIADWLEAQQKERKQ